MSTTLAFCKRIKNSGLLKALLILLPFVVFVGPPSRIRGADAFTNHHLWLINSRCNHCERQRKKQCQLTKRGCNHVMVHSSVLFVSSATVENQNILHDKAKNDENSYNSINTRSKKETQNNNNDNYNIRPHLRQLLQLCRPINFPVVVILHLLGIHQSVQLYQKSRVTAAATTTSISLLATLFKDPAMLMVLLSLLLVTSTSMITNDYYDAREGVDSPHDMRHPLAASAAATAATIPLPHHGTDSTITDIVIPLSVAKYFTKCLYAILLLTSAFVPSIMARILVLGGAMITYLYTVHLKPITWMKNISCAALVALGPITSGCAAWHVLRINSVIGSADVILPWFCILQSPLSFLVISLFFGIMGREVLMDIIDCVGDARAGIETIPVRYGKRIAANVALVCSLISSISACVMPMWKLCCRMLLTMRGGGSPLGLNTGGMTLTLIAIVQKSEARRLLLSLVGSGMLLRRIYDVWWTTGEDNTLVNLAVDESLLSVLLVLASFL